MTKADGADQDKSSPWARHLDPGSRIKRLATHLTSFDKLALASAKAQVNRITLPPDADVRAEYAEYSASLTWPGRCLAAGPAIEHFGD